VFGFVTQAVEAVKEFLNEPKHFTQRRKVAKAQRKQSNYFLRSLRLGAFA
jgi:hypothetical protein